MMPVNMPSYPSQSTYPQATHVTNYVSEPPVHTVTNYITTDQVRTVKYVSEPARTMVVETPVGVEWVPASPSSPEHLTGRAVLGGKEYDGNPIWIIRSWCDGNLIPGRLALRQKSALIPFKGAGLRVEEIEVLCARPEKIRWEQASVGNVPPGAIPGGVTSQGETLYVGRAKYQNSLIPGKVQPSNQCCYIVYSSQEIAVKDYEVLTLL
jgi:hypothetical protein